MEVVNQAISYQEIRNGIKIVNDKYKIGSLFTSSHRDTFLSNPNLKDEKSTLLYLSRVDGEIGGIIMLFPCKMSIGDKLIYVQEGSTLEVAEQFRHHALGIDLMLYPLSVKDANVVLLSGISEMALPIYKKIGYKVLEFPRAMQLRKSRSLLCSKGLKGAPLSFLSLFIDIGLNIHRKILSLLIYRLEKRFEVQQVVTVPDWVDDILKNDNHQFKEYHDKAWLEWNLNHNLHGRKHDVQRFYSISYKGKPMGFFMIKERYREVAAGTLKDLIIGSIVEWGSFDESILTESDIYILASRCFGSSVSIVEYATSNQKTIKIMKRHAFIPHGFAHIIVNDLLHQYDGIGDINNWRVRYGYADVILT